MPRASALVRFAAIAILVLAALASQAVGLTSVLGDGFSWVTSPSPYSHYDAACRVPGEVWVVGDSGAWRSTNGASTWTTVSASALEGISFPNASSGWMSGQSGVILHTTNSGSTWTTQTAPTSAALGRVRALDAQNAWIPVIGDSGRVLRTHDGGANWSISQATSTGPVYGVGFADAEHGWAAGHNGLMSYSSDGGQTWSPQNSGIADTIQDISVVSASEVWACADGGKFLHTTNGGQTWSVFSHSDGRPVYAIKFLSASEGWAVAWDRVYHTTDGGTTWETASTANTTMLYGVAFATGARQTGYFPAYGKVLKVELPRRVAGSAGPHGSITPTESSSCAFGSASPTFTITPDAGYRVSDVSVNGVSAGTPASYRIVNVSTDSTVSASFAVAKIHASISRNPGSSSKTFRRRHGYVKFTLGAAVNGAPYHSAGQSITLQRSSNGRTWKKLTTLTTNSSGKASKTIKATRKGTTYYRWTIADTARHYSATSSKFKAVVK